MPAPSVFTLEKSTSTARPYSGYIVDHQTLAPGYAINVHGPSISLPLISQKVVVGSSTQRFSISLATIFTLAISFKNNSCIEGPSSEIFIDGQSLRPGVSDGTLISLFIGGLEVILGSDTKRLLSPASATDAVTASDARTDSTTICIIHDQTIIKRRHCHRFRNTDALRFRRQ